MINYQSACQQLKDVLAGPQTPDEMRLISHADQIGATLRDCSEEKREQVIQNLVNNEGMNEDDARDWVDRLINQLT